MSVAKYKLQDIFDEFTGISVLPKGRINLLTAEAMNQAGQWGTNLLSVNFHVDLEQLVPILY